MYIKYLNKNRLQLAYKNCIVVFRVHHEVVAVRFLTPYWGAFCMWVPSPLTNRVIFECNSPCLSQKPISQGASVCYATNMARWNSIYVYFLLSQSLKYSAPPFDYAFFAEFHRNCHFQNETCFQKRCSQTTRFWNESHFWYKLVVDFMMQKAIFLLKNIVYGFIFPSNFSDKTILIGFYFGQLFPLAF